MQTTRKNQEENNQISRCFNKSTTWGRRATGVNLILRFQFLRRLPEIPVSLVLSVALLRTNYFYSPCTFVFFFGSPRISPECSTFTSYLEYAIRTFIELSGGGKIKNKSALPNNQTLINGFFSVANEGSLPVNHNFGTFIFHLPNNHYPCVSPMPPSSWRISW